MSTLHTSARPYLAAAMSGVKCDVGPHCDRAEGGWLRMGIQTMAAWVTSGRPMLERCLQ